jgi:hypothetical protein
MSLEVIVLGLFSGLRPGTSLAAVLALLKTSKPQRPLLFFIAAGFAWSWAIGLLILAVFNGANVAFGGSTFTAVLDVALGAAALGFAAGLQQGWVQPRRPRSSSGSAALAVAVYDVLWFLVPLASLVLVVVRPGAAVVHLEAATAWAGRHEHAVLVTGSLVLGGYLVVKGSASLLT